jgi:hypothetical protein
MIELLEHLLNEDEGDFEDLFQPVSDEEAMKRYDKRTDELIKSHNLTTWMYRYWDDDIDEIVTEFNACPYEKDMMLLATILADTLGLVVEQEFGQDPWPEGWFMSPESLMFDSLGHDKAKQLLCFKFLKNVLKLDMEKFKVDPYYWR